MLPFLQQNKEITSLSWFKLKAISRYFFEIKNIQDLDKLQEILKFSKKEKLQLLFLWSGTNILFIFEIFEWIIIKNSLKWFKIKWDILELWSWELISVVSNKLLKDFKNNCFISWIWLPWTIGGAVIWNAGSFGLEVKDVFIWAKVLDLANNQILEVDKNFMKFEYRNSRLKKNNKYFLISAKFSIKPRQNEFNLDQIIKKRKTQPSWFTCGSFFKNPTWNFAWKLIEEVWLKWKKNWWAFVSDKHSNFIMSNWKATYKDILDLVKLIKKEVFKKFWIKLEEEVRIIRS